MLKFQTEITEVEYKKAVEKGACSVLNEAVLYGFGCTGAEVKEEDGKYFIVYERKE